MKEKIKKLTEKLREAESASLNDMKTLFEEAKQLYFSMNAELRLSDEGEELFDAAHYLKESIENMESQWIIEIKAKKISKLKNK